MRLGTLRLTILLQIINIMENFHINKNNSCICTKVADKTIILNLDNDQYYELNSTGSAIWHAIDENNSFESLISYLNKSFNTEKIDLVSELKNFLDECQSRGFISLN